VITQTVALFVDAYRELNARKLFWITMGLSLLVVLVIGSFGLSERGVTFLHWTFDNPLLNSKLIPPEKFYIFLFANFAIPIWLSWVAAILALVSTASIIPEFVAGGSIELSLSKPIGRVRLFLTKYLTGLLFVALQVLVFTAACFVVILARGGSAEPQIFLAVPIVVLFFSYIYSVCALFGLLTRSTIASLLLTLLFWFLVFGVNTADGIFLAQRAGTQLRVQDATKRVERIEKATREQIDKARAAGEPVRAEGEALPPGATDELEVVNPLLASARRDTREFEKELRTYEFWTRNVVLLKTVLPKTQETVALLDRSLLSPEDKDLFGRDDDDAAPATDEDRPRRGPAMADPRVERLVDEAIRGRTVWWVVGTSLAFEAVVLTIACVIFRRRDF
jgi:hypothetical protein